MSHHLMQSKKRDLWIKAISIVALVFLWLPVQGSLAQTPPKGVKIYSGYLHHYGPRTHDSFWHVFWGKKTPKEGEVDYDSQCSIEFDGPLAFTHQSVASIPDRLSYFIKFKNGPLSSVSSDFSQKGAFDKFLIKIYTNDEEEYDINYAVDSPIGPEAEGKQIGLHDEHHIYDSYLIYLILG